ncbi:MAG: toll/interleukin-1 receptor domain-containing protein, partial [Methanobrevibacter sp.]|nr:toll/interleukin-1 receptor domain-containing protein [Methanobrevibacter sp.]
MKAFISYDSRDRNRFVEEFAEKLMSKGIDVWYDKWELEYGDSLVRIFDEIVKCDIFISIISKYSVNSNWVKEESDSAFIGKIENRIRKFIPVILMEEDLKIPNQFGHMVQCRIYDIENYDSEFKTLVGNIWGISSKPSLGTKPKYVEINPISGYEIFDSIVIKAIGDYMVKNGNVTLDFNQIVELTEDYEISEEDIQDSIEDLESKGIVNYTNCLGDIHPQMIKLTSGGMIIYSENYLENFSEVLKDIVSIILNMGRRASEKDFEEVPTSMIVVESVVELFSNLGYFKLKKHMGGFLIFSLKGNGKRQLKNYLD